MNIVRNCMSTNIKKIELVDQFSHHKKQQYSQCWKNNIKSNAGTLKNESMSKQFIYKNKCNKVSTIINHIYFFKNKI